MFGTRTAFRPRIDEPCTQDWSSMSASDAGRHCCHCNQVVYDLAKLTQSQAEELAHLAGGHLCARVTLRKDGSVITADRKRLPPASGALVAIALAVPAAAQTNHQDPAIVTGTVLMPRSQTTSVSAEVVFVQNEAEVLRTSTNKDGSWHAELAPGTYDVIFRSGVLFGQRVKQVQLHSGVQEFSAVQETFNLGHLGTVDSPNQETMLMGSVVSVITGMSFRYASRHPLAYLNLLRRRVSHALTS